MNRIDLVKDIKDTLGIVPKFFDTLSDETLEHKWKIFKGLMLSNTSIPAKYKELIGLAVSATLRCKYCTLFHSEGAKMQGATEDEIRESLLVAKLINGWSTYLNGSQYDFDLFKSELEQIGSYLSGKAEADKEVMYAY